MRSPWSFQHLVNFGRRAPLNLLRLRFVSILVLITVLGSPSSNTLDSFAASPIPDIYRNYRKLKEQTASDFLEIKSLSLGITHPRELDLCGKVPCYNISANLLAGFHNGEEFDRHSDITQVGPRCLVRPPKDYKIPLRWPAGRNVIWSGNVKIIKDQFVSSRSMTKRCISR